MGLLSALVFSTVITAATYQVDGSVGSANSLTVVAGSREISCHPVGPKLSLSVDGPADLTLLFLTDLPRKKRKKVKPFKLVLKVDGKNISKTKIKPQRMQGMEYAPARKRLPSKPASAISLTIGEGTHSISLKVPKRVSGCLVLKGAEQAPAESPVMVVAEKISEPVLALSSVELELDPVSIEPELLAPEPELALAAPEPALSALLPKNAEVVETISAAAVTTVSVTQNQKNTDLRSAAQRLLVGLKVGGVLPRAGLNPSLFVGAAVDVPAAILGIPRVSVAGVALGLSLYGEAGWSPMASQDEVMVPGRGRTQLLQNSLVIPMEAGMRATLDIGLPFIAYGAAGLAMDVTRTKIQTFSLPVHQENDVAFGLSLSAGGMLAMGPGQLVGELRYREVKTDLGAYNDLASPTLSAAAIYVGYMFTM